MCRNNDITSKSTTQDFLDLQDDTPTKTLPLDLTCSVTGTTSLAYALTDSTGNPPPAWATLDASQAQLSVDLAQGISFGVVHSLKVTASSGNIRVDKTVNIKVSK